MLTPVAWLHNLDPFALRFPDAIANLSLVPEGIRWYGLSYLAGFVVGYLLIRLIVSTGRSSLKVPELYDFVFVVAVGVLVGGRVGYVLFYRPELLVQFGGGPPFWGLLAIQDGGMASHGGILGMMLAAYLYARRGKHRWSHLLDLIAFATPIGVFFGRVANFVNGELLGRPCAADFPLAVKFPQELMEPHMVGKLDVLVDVVPHLPRPEAVFTQGDLIGQTIVAVQRGNAQVIAAVEPLLTPRHPSQLYAAMTEGLVVMAVLLVVWAKPRRPGVVLGWGLATYGLMRVFNEFFRTPDAHLGLQWLGLSRGQWLSLPVMITGVVLIVWASRQRHVEPLGGWRDRGQTG